jgi:hypothetical protein
MIGIGKPAIMPSPPIQEHTMALSFKTASETSQSKLAWEELNPATLPKELRQAYEAYREAYQTAKALREKFAGLMEANVTCPTGTELVLGYRFGKLSYAFDVPRARSAKSAARSFADIQKR